MLPGFNHYRVYRKIGGMEMDRLNELTAVFELAVKEAYVRGLADRSKTVAPIVDKPSETIEHGGLILRKVERPSMTGDFVRFSGIGVGGTQDGKLYEVINDVEYINNHGTNLLVTGWRSACPNPEIFEVVGAVPNDAPPSPNQQRYETIKRAREFVEERKVRGNDHYKKRDGIGFYFAYAEFHEKGNRVTCLLKGLNSNMVRSVGRAVCSPGDVFNSDIGKAIALARALEIDIPVEFTNAVQPNEVVVGMRVKTSNSNSINKGWGTGVVTSIEVPCVLRGYWVEDHTYSNLSSAVIIDDTNAIYEGDSHE